jgi:hypothetical protein
MDIRYYRIETYAGVHYLKQDAIVEIRVMDDCFKVYYTPNCGTSLLDIRASTEELSKTYSMEEILKMEGVK